MSGTAAQVASWFVAIVERGGARRGRAKQARWRCGNVAEINEEEEEPARNEEARGRPRARGRGERLRDLCSLVYGIKLAASLVQSVINLLFSKVRFAGNVDPRVFVEDRNAQVAAWSTRQST